MDTEILRRVSHVFSIFLWSINYTKEVCISYRIVLDLEIVLVEGALVFSFLVFSIYENHNSNHNLLVLALFPDLEVMQFWSINYVCQICNLHLLFWTCPKFSTIFIFAVFREQKNFSAFSFC